MDSSNKLNYTAWSSSIIYFMEFVQRNRIPKVKNKVSSNWKNFFGFWCVWDEWFNELFYLEFIIERGLTKEWKLINEFLGKIMRIAIPWRNKIVICRNVSQHFPPSHLLYLSTWFLWNSISILKRRRRRSSRSQSKRKKDSEIREKLVKVLGFILGHFLHLFSFLKR